MRRAIAVTLAVPGLLLTTALNAQVGSMRVTVPSPTAASLGKFGDVPVSLYTGVPDISIPLFTAKGRTLELPIVLRYHASGIRVEEIGSWVGLGWTLEAGGAITRTVRGIADDKYPNGYYYTGGTFYTEGNWPDPGPTIIDQIASEQLDGEPDQFFFSFAGRSGQFVMGPTSTSTIEYRAIPYQRLRIEPAFGATGIDSWAITTEDGTRYTFAATETNTDYNLTSPGDLMPTHYGDSHVSAWHVTEIRSPGGDVVRLTYGGYTARHRLGTYREKFDQVVSNPGYPPCVPSEFETTNEYEISALRLDSITTAAHTITFTVGSTLRTDALSPTGAQQEPRLDKITVKTPMGTVLRIFQFEHDYFPGNRLRLRSVYEQDRNGVLLPPYSFTYDGQTLPALTSYALDHWGYYNGKTSNSTSIPPAITPSGAALSGADRSPDPAFMKAGVLTKVTHPTGGFNEFIYEANDYAGVGQDTVLPSEYGPPQSRHVVSDGVQYIQSAPFTVGGTDTIIATVDVSMSPACGDQIGCPWTDIQGVATWSLPGRYYQALAPGPYTLRAYSEFSDSYASITVSWRDYGPTKKKAGGGLRVAELRTADAMGNFTIRKYRYTLQGDTTKSSGLVNVEPDYDYSYGSPQCSYFSRSSMSKMPLGGGAPVSYREVTVWHGPNGEYGKTRHTFRSVLHAADPAPSGVWPFSRRTSYEWMRGQELGATEYNVAAQIQRQLASTYAFPLDEPETTRRYRGLAINSFSAGQFGSVYVHSDFEVISSWSYQDSSTATVYDTTGTSSFATTKTFVYGNPNHLQLTEVTEINSDGTERITRMKYPADYATGMGDPEAAALTAMQGSAHMHSPVIERWVIEKVGATEKIVQAELTTFKEYALGQYRPYRRFIFNSPGPIQ